jgi:acyl dehydratase
MPIDLDKAIGAELPDLDYSWDQSAVILYHLGVGAGVPAAAPGELEYCYEANLKVLPSFGSIPAFGSMMHMGGVDGLDFNFAMLLHGEQETILNGPIPTSGTVRNRARITDIFDKGKGALVVLEVVSETEQGDELFRNIASIFLRGEGGFGGPTGPAATNDAPDRDPDAVVESTTMEQQALLYRLSGDPNPLHVDPAFAAMGGFDRPILHGLCSYGIVCKAVVDNLLDGDVSQVASYRARFAGSVLPGDTIVTSMWDEPDRIIVSAQTKERGTPVISNAAVTNVIR